MEAERQVGLILCEELCPAGCDRPTQGSGGSDFPPSRFPFA